MNLLPIAAKGFLKLSNFLEPISCLSQEFLIHFVIYICNQNFRIQMFYFASNSIFGFRFDLLRGFLVFSLKVTYELLSIILAYSSFIDISIRLTLIYLLYLT